MVADMPGLIEGAHEGVGLGHQFLRHIERTRLLVHLIDVSGFSGREPVRDFDAINNELRAHGEKLSGLVQVVALNKIDVPGARDIADPVKAELECRGLEVFEISAVAGDGIRLFCTGLRLCSKSFPGEEIAQEKEVRFYGRAGYGRVGSAKTGEGEFVVEGRSVEAMEGAPM